jgi:hypothetical protein
MEGILLILPIGRIGEFFTRIGSLPPFAAAAQMAAFGSVPKTAVFGTGSMSAKTERKIFELGPHNQISAGTRLLGSVGSLIYCIFVTGI